MKYSDLSVRAFCALLAAAILLTPGAQAAEGCRDLLEELSTAPDQTDSTAATTDTGSESGNDLASDEGGVTGELPGQEEPSQETPSEGETSAADSEVEPEDPQEPEKPGNPETSEEQEDSGEQEAPEEPEKEETPTQGSSDPILGEPDGLFPTLTTKLETSGISLLSGIVVENVPPLYLEVIYGFPVNPQPGRASVGWNGSEDFYPEVLGYEFPGGVSQGTTTDLAGKSSALYDDSEGEELWEIWLETDGTDYFIRPEYLPTADGDGNMTAPVIDESISMDYGAVVGSGTVRVPDYQFTGRWYLYGDQTGNYYSAGDVGAAAVEFVPGTPLSSYWTEEVFQDAAYPDGGTYYLDYFNIIGAWTPSANADATAINLTGHSGSVEGAAIPVYTEDVLTLTRAELEEKTAAEFDSDQTTYYARVPAETDALTFDLTAYEPGSILEVTVRFGEESNTYLYNHTDGALVKTEVGKASGGYGPQNSAENPARSVWSLAEGITIPLEQAEPGMPETHNVVTFAVTAPDGVSTKIYTYHIQRLTDPVIALTPGNSPYGMVERTTGAAATEAWKEQVKAAFVDNDYAFSTDRSQRPSGGNNNNGNIYTGAYDPRAWGEGENPDLDENALFAYQDSAFVIPVPQAYSAIGEADNSGLTWSATLTQVATLDPRAVMAGTAGESAYTINSLSPEVDLRGVSLKPGIYEIQYQIDDPYSGKCYSTQQTDSFQDYGSSSTGYQRSLVILPIRGDVDMDGAVTVADGYALRELLEEKFFADDLTTLKRLYFFRVCDVTGDGKVDEADADQLLDGWFPQLESGGESDYFYLPLDSTDEGRQVLREQEPEDGKIRLTLEYLGVRQSDGSYDSSPLDFNAEEPTTFWLGLRAENAGVLTAAVEDFTFTLTYDGSYVQPLAVEEILAANSSWSGYALHSGSGIVTTPVDHYSKSLPGLTFQTDLRELRISLAGSGSTLAELNSDGMLLLIPFTLAGLPEGETAQLIEPVLGMRDFTLVLADGAAMTWNYTRSVTDRPVPASLTTNADNYFTYGGSDAIPLGEDVTPRYIFKLEDGSDPVYGTQAELTHAVHSENGTDMRFVNGFTLVSGSLPEGMSLPVTGGTISGTPEAAGTYDFIIRYALQDYHCRIVVEKAPLTLTVTDVDKYYGEDSETTTEQTFTFDTSQIKDLDRTPLGNGEQDLEALGLKGYTPPAIRLVTSVDTGHGGMESLPEAAAGTEPGSYWVVLSGGGSDNYRFIYTRSGDQGETTISEDFGWGTLTIHPRPIRVTAVTKSPAATTGEYAVDRAVGGLMASYLGGEFSLEAVPVDADGTYQGIPLTANTLTHTGDELVLGYTATFQGDNPSSPFFNLDDNEMTKAYPVTISALTLPQSEGENACYVLYWPDSGAEPAPTAPSATGVVAKRLATSIAITGPGTVSYTYGERLNLGSMQVAVQFSDLDTPLLLNTPEDLARNNLTLTWGDADGPGTEPVSGGQIITVTDHDGAYLWVTHVTGARARTEQPITVTPKELTLTVQPVIRFYGELARYVVTYDAQQLASWDAAPERTGTDLEQLSGLAGYTAPQVTGRTGEDMDSSPVDAGTDVGSYYLHVSGGAADNYRFVYTRSDGEAGAEVSGSSGYNTLTVLPRPIVVTSVNTPAGTIFPHSEVTVITGATAAAGGDSQGFTAVLPRLAEEPTGGSGPETPKLIDHFVGPEGALYWTDTNTAPPALTGSAIYGGDTLTLRYNTDDFTAQRDNETPPYFDLDGQSEKRITVQINGIRLENGGNYVLVYPTSESAINGWVMERDDALAGRTTGTVTVAQRQVERLEVVSGPDRTDYIYGEQLDLRGLTVRIVYDDGGEETVPYSESIVGGILTNTFEGSGLTVRWGSAQGGEAENHSYPVPARHDGVALVVTGQGQSVAVGTISVAKRTLTLTVTGQSRYYGEENLTYGFTFANDQLTDADKALVSGMDLSGSAATLNTAAVSTALDKLNEGYGGSYSAPAFQTSAVSTSPVSGGPYPLTLTGGEMANYQLEFVDGTISVEKRPVVISKVIRSPIYSVYSSETKLEFTAYAYAGVFAGEDGTSQIYDDQLTLALAAGTTGTPLLAGDGIGVSMKITYPDKNTWPSLDSVTTAPVTVSVSDLVLTAGSENYILRFSGEAGRPTDPTATAQVSRLKIERIALYSAPGKLTYTYGEQLDLSGLQVEVYYEGGGSSRVDPSNVDWLYVNYWEGSDAPTAEQLNGSLAWAQAASGADGDHPLAATGDHLTRVAGSYGFQHHGKYLIITARTVPTEEGTFVEPVVVPIPIQVRQRQLTFTLAVNGKIYDGTPDTTGTVTLTNVLDRGGTLGLDQVAVADDTVFTFCSSDVSYLTVGDHLYDTPVPIKAAVSGISLTGADSGNYAIVGSVAHTDSLAPSAVITPADQTAPDTAVELTVDVHTNVVKVEALRPVSDFIQQTDNHRGEIHYEYALIYTDPETGLEVTTPWQDSPFFGGEVVTVTAPEGFEPGGAGVGLGQSAPDGDGDFGTRTPLPRGIYFRAQVRLSQSNNFTASPETLSVSDADLNDAIQAAEEAVPVVTEGERTIERFPGPVIKTYRYRLTLISTEEVRGEDEQDYRVPTLEEVWFTDLTGFAEKRELDLLFDNSDPTKYYGYYWDEAERVALEFPLTITDEMWVEMPVEGGEAGETTLVDVNADDSLVIYVTTEDPNVGVLPRAITIEPDHLVGRVGDSPAELTVTFEPWYATYRQLRWTSSNPAVAQVSKDGVVTFVGVGTAEISAATINGLTASVKVTVLGEVPYADTMFNAAYLMPFFELENGYFYPDRVMTRGEMVTLVARFFQEPLGGSPSAARAFDDVSDEDACAQAVELLSSWGVVEGVDGGSFAPDRTATRAEMSTLLSRLLMLPLAQESAGAFLDVTPETTWAWAYIDALAQADIVQGVGGGYFDPNGMLTRGQAATFLFRVLVTVADLESDELVIPLDAPAETHWSYDAILRAVNPGVSAGAEG